MTEFERHGITLEYLEARFLRDSLGAFLTKIEDKK